MTAHDLIAQWFARPQTGVASNMRYVTLAQMDLLWTLVSEDPEGRAARRGVGRSFTWMPSGRNKYVLTEGRDGRRNTILCLGSLQPTDAGTLFEGKEAAETTPEPVRGCD